MKHLFLAAAAALTLSTGVALADGDVTAQPAQAPRVLQAAPSGYVDGSGIYVANTPRHEVWVYGAFSHAGTAEGGEN